jgi:hypothetical protein
MTASGTDAFAAMEPTLAEMTALGCWEWQLRAFDGDTVTLIGGQNMVYGYFAEARFSGVTYISCPTRMMHAEFRLATEWEAISVRLRAEIERGTAAIAITSQTTSSLEEVSFLVARAVEVTEGQWKM